MMGLRDMYAYAIQTAKGRFHGNAEERDGKLHFKGTVATDEDKNLIWDAIKTIPTWQQDVTADIKVTGPATGAASSANTYTVKDGDTLGAIAQKTLGRASAYPKIFELNKDQLSAPDKIKPGQVLRLPDRE